MYPKYLDANGYGEYNIFRRYSIWAVMQEVYFMSISHPGY